MVASTEPSSPKVPLLAKFGKPRAPLINSVSYLSVNSNCSNLQESPYCPKMNNKSMWEVK